LGNCTTLLFKEGGSGFLGKEAGGGAGFVNVIAELDDGTGSEPEGESGCIGSRCGTFKRVWEACGCGELM